MANDLVKRMVKKDGSERISFYRMDYADNPRDMTDEPLHCEDWSRDYHSIMSRKEKECKSSSARELLEYLLLNHGDWKKIIDVLVRNGKHMTDGKSVSNDALVYNKSEHRWDLMSNMLHYNYETKKNEMGWCLNSHYYETKYNIDLDGLLADVCDETIDYLVEEFLTDKVKIASYYFGYYGGVTFADDFDCKSEGIAWLEKDTFLKYSGCSEDYWNGNTLREIEGWLFNEIEAWSEGEVYGFQVEKAVKKIVNVRYPNGEYDDSETEETEWEEKDSCWCFYGEFDKALDWMIEQAGFEKEELEDEA